MIAMMVSPQKKVLPMKTDLMKNMKFVLIVVGLLIIVVTVFNHVAIQNPNNPITSASQGSNIAAILGFITAAVGLFMDFKKAIPPELIAKVLGMLKSGKIDPLLIMEIMSGKYGKIDIEQLKLLFDNFKDLNPTPSPGPAPKDEVATDVTVLRNVLANFKELPKEFSVKLRNGCVYNLTTVEPSLQK